MSDNRARLAAAFAARQGRDVVPARTEYGWACGRPDCEVSPHTPDPGQFSDAEAWVRSRVASAGGKVLVREVSDWRAEP